MDDLIGRQKALDAIMSIWGYADEMYKALNELPSVQHWIPCSKKSPDRGGWFLVTEIISEDCKKVGLKWYSTAHGWEFNEPIAWMPLPEPYGGETNETD